MQCPRLPVRNCMSKLLFGQEKPSAKNRASTETLTEHEQVENQYFLKMRWLKKGWDGRVGFASVQHTAFQDSLECPASQSHGKHCPERRICLYMLSACWWQPGWGLSLTRCLFLPGCTLRIIRVIKSRLENRANCSQWEQQFRPIKPRCCGAVKRVLISLSVRLIILWEKEQMKYRH